MDKIYIDDHAVLTYIERIEAVTPIEARKEIERCVQKCLFRLNLGAGSIIIGCRNQKGKRFLALDEHEQVIVVGPHFFWHEARPEWRKLGWSKRAGAYEEPVKE